MSKDMSNEWDYRVVRQTTEDGAEWLSVFGVEEGVKCSSI
jgi:hypothetical protein